MEYPASYAYKGGNIDVKSREVSLNDSRLIYKDQLVENLIFSTVFLSVFSRNIDFINFINYPL